MEPDNSPWDELATRAARVGSARPAGLSLDTLQAYRAGELDEAETERVEAALAADPEARELLIDLAAEPSAFLKRWAAQQVRPAARGRWLAGGAVGILAAAALLMVFLRPPAMPPAYLLDALRRYQTNRRSTSVNAPCLRQACASAHAASKHTNTPPYSPEPEWRCIWGFASAALASGLP